MLYVDILGQRYKTPKHSYPEAFYCLAKLFWCQQPRMHNEPLFIYLQEPVLWYSTLSPHLPHCYLTLESWFGCWVYLGSRAIFKIIHIHAFQKQNKQKDKNLIHFFMKFLNSLHISKPTLESIVELFGIPEKKIKPRLLWTTTQWQAVGVTQDQCSHFISLTHRESQKRMNHSPYLYFLCGS